MKNYLIVVINGKIKYFEFKRNLSLFGTFQGDKQNFMYALNPLYLLIRVQSEKKLFLVIKLLMSVLLMSFCRLSESIMCNKNAQKLLWRSQVIISVLPLNICLPPLSLFPRIIN